MIEIRFPVHHVEALEQVAAACPLVGHVDGCMAVNAGPRLVELLHALRIGLIVEHVGVAAFFTEVGRERVAGPHPLQPRILLNP
jgi:hypothetical protein